MKRTILALSLMAAMSAFADEHEHGGGPSAVGVGVAGAQASANAGSAAANFNSGSVTGYTSGYAVGNANSANSSTYSGAQGGNATSSSGIQANQQGVNVNFPAQPSHVSNDVHSSGYINNVPAMGSVYSLPTAPCMGSTGVTSVWAGFGIGGNTSWTDEECSVRETVRTFMMMHREADALAVLCTSKFAKAAPSCAGVVAAQPEAVWNGGEPR